MTSKINSVSMKYRLNILLLVVLIAGMSQGLLLPVLTILLEQRGVSSYANGLNSAALYIGIFSTMFFIEIPLRRYGYKKVMGAGILLVSTATLIFSFTHLFVIWFILRLLVGVGDSALHYASQLWIVSSSPPERRGRYISYYGMAYGVGFSIGPLGSICFPMEKLSLLW